MANTLLNAKIDYSKRGAFDELYTPDIAIQMIIPYIPKHIKTVWECTAHEESKIVNILRNCGYEVISTHIKDGYNFFNYVPKHFDMTITNPPYSLKDDFLARGFQLGKPFMFLLPLTTLEGSKRSKMFRENKIQLIIPDKRFNFKPEKNSGAWFQTSWFTYGLNLEKDLNFISL